MKPTTSPIKSIAAHCKGCIYDAQCLGNWRQQVEACTITNCELYEHRPITYKSKRIQKENELAMLSTGERELIEIRNTQRALNMRNLRASSAPAPATHAN